jgi:hypothetical protein
MEKIIGTNSADTFTNDSVKADSDFISADGGANTGGNDTADYSGASQAIYANVNGTTITLTHDADNGRDVDAGENDDVLTNFEVLQLGSGDDTVFLEDISNIDTIHGGSGANSLLLGAGVSDLSGITLVNLNSIIASSGQTVTLNATQLDGGTYKLVTIDTGKFIIQAGVNTNDHDFDNITVDKQGSGAGEVTLDVNNSLDLTTKNLGNNSLFDKFDVDNSATLTISLTQATGKSGVGTGTLKISDGSISAANANTLAGNFNEILEATVDSDSASALNTALTNATSADKLTLTVTGATAAASDLNGLDGRTAIDVIVDASKVTGSFAELNTIYVTNNNNFANFGDENVDISGTNSATDVNTIANATSGVVTATVSAGTASALNTALENASATDALDLTVSAGNVDAAHLIALNGKTNQVIDVTALTSSHTINGNASELIDIYVTNVAQFNGLGNEQVTVDDTATAANVNSIANATSGAVTATISTGAVSTTLNAIENVDGNDIITFTTNDTSADATDIVALNAKVDTFGVNTITTVTENAATIGASAVNVTDAIAIVGNTHAVTISGAISAADTNTIAGVTSGVVTATITADTAANLNTALSDVSLTGGDALSLTVSAGNVDAAHLIALNGKTNQVIDVTALTGAHTINGNASELIDIYVTNAAQFNGLGNEQVTVDDTASAANVNSIANATTGVVTATVTADSAANLNSNLANASNDALNITTTGTGASASDLNGLDNKTSIDVNVTSVTDISGTVADIKTVYDNSANFTGLGNEDITVTASGTFDATDILDFDTTGSLTMNTGDDTLVFDTQAELNTFSGEFNAIVDNGGNDTIQIDGAVSGDIDFAQFSEYENLQLSNSSDSLTISSGGDEPTNIKLGGGDDTATLDFSNIDNFNIDGEAGSDDTVTFNSGSTNSISSDTIFGHANSFDNIETLDFSSLTLDTADVNTEFEITESLIEGWTDTGNDLTLVLDDATQADRIKFTDKDGNIFDGQANTVSDGGTYQIDDNGTTLTIDLVNP